MQSYFDSFASNSGIQDKIDNLHDEMRILIEYFKLGEIGDGEFYRRYELLFALIEDLGVFPCKSD